MSDDSVFPLETAYLTNKLYKYRKMVVDASCNKKIFTIYGHYPAIAKALKSRGWIEKCANHQISDVYGAMSLPHLLYQAAPGNTFEAIVLTRLLQNTRPHFIWNPAWSSNDTFIMSQTIKNHINHLSELNFTTKEGLVHCSRNRLWNTIDDHSELNTPRSFVAHDSGEIEAFWKSFKRTACISLLVFITENPCVFAPIGSVRGSWVNFALDRVQESIDDKNHMTIDGDQKSRLIYEADWKLFFINYRNIITKSANIQLMENFGDKLEQIHSLLKTVFNIWPNARFEGMYNIWIMKPKNDNRGNGILLFDDPDKIHDFLGNKKNRRYIIQKYIERPLLIYRTKFDIRQHFLLTIDNQHETIWMYNSCYFRFSSQEFNLKSLQQAIHLTNVAVQKHQKNNPNRSKLLPEQNMWSLEQFKKYLCSIDQESLWESKIVPEMKKNIVAVVLCAQEATVFEINTFELYGCDFLITENFDVLLLEVNSNPNLSPSTEVNANFFPVLLSDVVKVVIDKPKLESKIGDFVQIGQMNIPSFRFVSSSLIVQGRNYNLLVKSQRIERARRISRYQKPKESFQPIVSVPPRIEGSYLRGMTPSLITYDYMENLSKQRYTIRKRNKSSSIVALKGKRTSSSRLLARSKFKRLQNRTKFSKNNCEVNPLSNVSNHSVSSLQKISDAIKAMIRM